MADKLTLEESKELEDLRELDRAGEFEGIPDEAINARSGIGPITSGIGPQLEFTPQKSKDLETMRGMFLPDRLNDLPLNTTTQGIPDAERLALKLGVLSPNEQITALRSKGYDAQLHRDAGASVLSPDRTEYRAVDPTGTNNFDPHEMGMEVAENLDMVPGMFAKAPVGGTVIGAGTGIVRQGIKKYNFPELPVSPGEIVADTVSGTVTGAANKAMTSGPVLAKAKLREAATLGGEALENTGAKGIFTSAGIKQRVNTYLNNPVRIAKEFRAPKIALRKVGRKPITENIKFLQDNAPEEFSAILKATSVEARANASEALRKKLKDNLTGYYSKSDTTVKVSDILDSDFFKKLSSKAEDATKTPIRKVRSSIGKIEKSVHDGLADLTLTPDELAMYNEPGQLAKYVFGEADGAAYNNADALKDLIADRELPIQTAFSLRTALDDLVSYGKETHQITTANAATKDAADAVRYAMHKAMGETDEGAAILKDNDVLSHLIPVNKILDNAQAAAGGIPKLRDFVPGVLNGKYRLPFLLTEKLSVRPEVTGRLQGFFNRAGRSATGGSADAAPLRPGPGMGALLGNLGRANVNETSRRLINRQLGPEQADPTGGDMFSEYAKQVFSPAEAQAMEPKLLPRSPELVLTDPQMSRALMSQLSPDAQSILNDAVNRKDPLAMEAAMTIAMSEVPDMFEKSITGLASEMIRGNDIVLTNPTEGQMYGATIASLYHQGALGEQGANFMAEQISYLNNIHHMKIMPRPDHIMSLPPPQNQTVQSPVSQMASRLR